MCGHEDASHPSPDSVTLQGDEAIAHRGEISSVFRRWKKKDPNILNHSHSVKESSPELEEGQANTTHRVLGRWQAALIFITNEVGLGVLSLPAALQTLGLIPGVIAIIGLGVITGYTAYVLLQMYRRYPDVANIADCGRKMGGRWLEAVIGIAFVINWCLTSASAGLTMSIALNSMSDHAMCTVAFIAFSIIACWLLCIPRSLGFVAQIGIPSTASIIASVIIIMISTGIDGPRQDRADGPPAGEPKQIVFVGNPSFTEGVVACLNIAFAYAGNQACITVMAEMKDPSRDFVPALASLQIFAVIIYTVVGAVTYSLLGQYSTSPALGAAPIVAAKVAYGIAFPCLLGTGLVTGHTAIKYLHVLTMRQLGAAHEMNQNTKRSWIAWLTYGTLFWICAFVLANAIPVFQSILSVSSALFVSWFSFGIPGLFWLHLNWREQFHSKRKMGLAALNWAVVAIALLMSTGGMYSAIMELLAIFNDPKSEVKGSFTCASNAAL